MRIRKDGQLDRRYFSKPPEQREKHRQTWARKRSGEDCMSGAALVASLGDGGYLNSESSPVFMWLCRRIASQQAAR